MTSTKLQKLFKAARNDRPPEPASAFEVQVLRAIRNEKHNEPDGLFERLGQLFPRLALASALLIVLCLGTDLWVSGFGQSKLASDLGQLSDQWLFVTKGF